METEINDNSIYIINPECRLIKNGRLRLLMNADDFSKYIILNQVSCVIVTLLRPDRTISRIVDICSYLYDIDHDSAFQVVAKSLSSINKSGVFIVIYKSGMDAQTYSPVDFCSTHTDVSDIVRLDVPLELGLTLTHNCNTDCRYCYAERKHIASDDLLSLDDWINIIEQARELGVMSVPLLGGDVLTYKHIFKVLGILRKYKYKIEISTKSHISGKFARELSGYIDENSFIQLSIDSNRDEIADFLVQKSGFLASMLDSINNLDKCGINIRVKSVMTGFNIKDVETLILMLHKYGVRRILIEDYGRSYFRHSDDLFVEPGLSSWARDRVAHIKNRYPEMEISYGAQSYEKYMQGQTALSDDELWNRWKKRNRCSAGSSSITIAPGGMVIPCEQMPQNQTHDLGNVRNNSLIEIWNSERLLNYVYPERELFAGGPCYDCEGFDDCHRKHGHCFRNALFSYNNHLLPSPDCPRAFNPKIRLV